MRGAHIIHLTWFAYVMQANNGHTFIAVVLVDGSALVRYAGQPVGMSTLPGYVIMRNEDKQTK